MFYYLYQITNKVNNKIYVGVHKTKSLDDGYMGSGKVIRNAIMKHGIENFEKVILEYFENQEAMYAREKEVVTEEFLLREDVYNLRRGGTGGFDYINKNMTLEQRSMIGKIARSFSSGNTGKMRTPEWRDAISESLKGRKLSDGTLGYEFSEKSKEKMSKSSSGIKNSQFGTMWITNDIENKKIKKTDSIPEGYRKGRRTIAPM